jgi:membrane-bound lytic murein transglycosylase D
MEKRCYITTFVLNLIVMKKQLMLFFCLFVLFCKAQEEHTPQKAISLNTALEQDNNLPAIDTTATLIDGGIFFEKKEQKYHLRDNEYAAKIDSLWLKQIYQSKWYETMYNTITNLSYSDTVYRNLPTDTLKMRLEKLNQKTPFNVEYNPELESVINTFLRRGKKYMEELMGAGAFYFSMFEQGLDNYKVPLEVKYLPIIESALDPRAKSRVGATGLWQFMYATGKLYDLDVSSYVDERSDPIKSTRAAGKYLADLYDLFKDWDLVLAAYNSGPGNVAKAIRRSGGYQNYWNLRPFLPRETAGYVPAFYATLYLFEYAEAHGFKPKKPEIPYFETDTVHVKQLITFNQIAEVLNINVELLRFFNPSYQLDIIPFIDGKQYPLRLPKELTGKFITNEQVIYAYAKAELEKREKALPQLFELDDKITYRVRSGDFLGRIANKYGVTVNQLKGWNRLRSNHLKIGQKLIVYSKKAIANQPSATVAATAEKIYIVKQGDTLWRIAQKFPGISVENIKEWNDISGDDLKPGMKLKVCSC